MVKWYLHQAMTLGLDGSYGKNTAIGIGMWLGLIMAYNVWFVIWPNQKRALGMIDCSPEDKSGISKNCNVVFKNKHITCHYQCCLQWLRHKTFIN